jgi:tetratricopeptide (TPR) repeat protein
MPADLGPSAVVGWLRAHGTTDGLAGCAFLIGPRVVLTCAHVIGAHLGLAKPVPADRPLEEVTIRFEALHLDARGHVLPGGWFRNIETAPGELSDIAVICLDEPIEAISYLPAIAQRMPTQDKPVVIYGTTNAFVPSGGQQVDGVLKWGDNWRAVRQIDPVAGGRRFTIGPGFSGCPALDDLGNVVWGMIVWVVDQEADVGYAIPPDKLWRALKSSGVATSVRASDEADQQAAEAMAKLRADYEAKLAERDSETERARQELDQLRQTVRSLEQEARDAPGDEAATALAALAEGDTLPATDSLRRKLDDRLAAAAVARCDAANLARQLGAMLKLTDAAGALAAYRQALACDPDDHVTCIEVARLERVAGTLDGAERAANAALRAAKDERARGVALNDLGNARLAQGDLAGALASYQAGHRIAEDLQRADPEGVEGQRDLAVSHNKIGEVKQAQGDLTGALASYQAAFDIMERLAEADPGNADWQRDLSISHERIGDVKQAQGDLTGALASYQAAFDIMERLAEGDPGNAGWQRDLSVSQENIGNVKRAQGDLTGALASYQAAFDIRERLAEADPGNTGWQRDLSISHEKIGNVKQAQGDLTGALASYQPAFDIMERLAGADPGNAGWQRDLSVSHDRVGGVKQAQGDLKGALASYQAAFDIRERLARADPGNALWQRDLAVSYGRVGEIEAELGATGKALSAMRQARDIVARLAQQSPTDATLRSDLAWYERRIAELEARGT